MTVVESNIICTRVLGGLGNQMFQYAAGLSLAQHVNAQLIVDTSSFSRYPLRNYALSAFGIHADEVKCRGEDTRPAIEVMRERLVRRLGRWGGPARWNGLIKVVEPHTQFWPGFYELKGNCYLEGYWQSAQYFRYIEQRLRKVFDLSRFSHSTSRKMEEAILEEPHSVAVHIRRGDYATNPLNMRTHGLCERAYYDRAKRLIEKYAGGTKFFIFSDEGDVARREFSDWTNTIFVPPNSQEQDMMLMSLCRHAIIANSSFSWWAAWLNRNPEKCVVAPRLWFSRERMRETSAVDLLPDDWILV